VLACSGTHERTALSIPSQRAAAVFNPLSIPSVLAPEIQEFALPDSRFESEDNFVLLPLIQEPSQAFALLETENEKWAVVPALSPYWAYTRALVNGGSLTQDPPDVASAYPASKSGRRGGEIVVRRKNSGKWYSLSLANRAWFRHPIAVDPIEKGVIWFGWANSISEKPTCCYGSGLLAGLEEIDELSLEAPERSEPKPADLMPKSYALDNGLCGSRIFGIARIDLERRAVAYFNGCTPAGSDVTGFGFDQDAVWLELKDKSVIVRLDRKSQQWEILPVPSTASQACSHACLTVTPDSIVIKRRAVVDIWNGIACSSAQLCDRVEACQRVESCWKRDATGRMTNGLNCQEAYSCARAYGCRGPVSCRTRERIALTGPVQLDKRDRSWARSSPYACPGMSGVK
jgi:hypothetical protein